MKIVVQRVLSASCMVDNQITGTINHGLMLLIGFTHTDDLEKVKIACKKIVNLRIFDDEEGKMNKSLIDVNGSVLAISQFTLYADTKKGNRPSFIESMRPDPANELYLQMIEILRNEYHIHTETGIFQSHMYLSPICDGPVTINLEI